MTFVDVRYQRAEATLRKAHEASQEAFRNRYEGTWFKSGSFRQEDLLDAIVEAMDEVRQEGKYAGFLVGIDVAKDAVKAYGLRAVDEHHLIEILNDLQPCE